MNTGLVGVCHAVGLAEDAGQKALGCAQLDAGIV
jgi:hypothetical protein